MGCGAGSQPQPHILGEFDGSYAVVTITKSDISIKCKRALEHVERSKWNNTHEPLQKKWKRLEGGQVLVDGMRSEVYEGDVVYIETKHDMTEIREYDGISNGVQMHIELCPDKGQKEILIVKWDPDLGFVIDHDKPDVEEKTWAEKSDLGKNRAREQEAALHVEVAVDRARRKSNPDIQPILDATMPAGAKLRERRHSTGNLLAVSGAPPLSPKTPKSLELQEHMQRRTSISSAMSAMSDISAIGAAPPAPVVEEPASRMKQRRRSTGDIGPVPTGPLDRQVSGESNKTANSAGASPKMKGRRKSMGDLGAVPSPVHASGVPTGPLDRQVSGESSKTAKSANSAGASPKMMGRRKSMGDLGAVGSNSSPSPMSRQMSPASAAGDLSVSEGGGKMKRQISAKGASADQAKEPQSPKTPKTPKSPVSPKSAGASAAPSAGQPVGKRRHSVS